MGMYCINAAFRKYIAYVCTISKICWISYMVYGKFIRADKMVENFFDYFKACCFNGTV